MKKFLTLFTIAVFSASTIASATDFGRAKPQKTVVQTKKNPDCAGVAKKDCLQATAKKKSDR